MERFAGDIDPSAAIIFRDYFPLETSLMIAAVRELVYAGDTYSTQSWILAQGHLDMHPRLAQVLDIWEVNNGFFFTKCCRTHAPWGPHHTYTCEGSEIKWQ